MRNEIEEGAPALNVSEVGHGHIARRSGAANAGARADETLAPEQSELLVLRLVLLLANQVANDETLAACLMEAAKPFKQG